MDNGKSPLALRTTNHTVSALQSRQCKVSQCKRRGSLGSALGSRRKRSRPLDTWSPATRNRLENFRETFTTRHVKDETSITALLSTKWTEAATEIFLRQRNSFAAKIPNEPGSPCLETALTWTLRFCAVLLPL